MAEGQEPSAKKDPSIAILNKELAPRVYADGVTQIFLGYPVSRLVLHHFAEKPIDPASGAPELRHVACELIMPTLGLIEMAKNILALSHQGKDSLKEHHDKWADLFEKTMGEIHHVPG